MPAKLLTLEEAAAMLGVSPSELSDMRNRGEVFGYRDGAHWKFKQDEVERVAADRGVDLSASEPLEPSDDLQLADDDDDAGSILVSDEELGHSAESTSSTIIGKGKSAGESDIKVADEPPVEDDLDLDPLASQSDGDDDLSLSDDDAVTLAGEDEDDLVLGAGSDVTLGAGDSGINLKSPTDSGLSLEEEPLDLGGSDIDSLELPEDDLVSLEEDADPEAATQLKQDDDFLLTPIEDASGDESDSGSQVIALDTEEFDEDSATMLGAAEAKPGFEEDPFAGGMPEQQAAYAGMGPGMAPAAGVAPVTTEPAEPPYTVANVVSLFLVMVPVLLAGLMTIDLMRNMYSWSGPAEYNSAIMDFITSLGS